jgi:hypothetical protein
MVTLLEAKQALENKHSNLEHAGSANSLGITSLAFSIVA